MFNNDTNKPFLKSSDQDLVKKAVVDTLTFFKSFDSFIVKKSDLFELLNTSELKANLKFDDFMTYLNDLIKNSRVYLATDNAGVDYLSLSPISESQLTSYLNEFVEFKNHLKKISLWIPRFFNKSNILYIGAHNPLFMTNKKNIPILEIVVAKKNMFLDLFIKIFSKKYKAQVKTVKSEIFANRYNDSKTESLYKLLGMIHLHTKDDYIKNLIYKRLKELKTLGNFPISKI